MEIRTFWKIVIKGIGLWFLIDTLYIIPQLASSLSVFDHDIDWGYSFLILGFNLVVFFIYILIVRFFLFHSEWIIDKLKLDKNFSQEKIDIAISAETVMRIIIIITGALVFIDGFPNLIREMYQFFQQKELIRNYPETSWLLFYLLKTLAGWLIMTNSELIGRYISKESKSNP